MPNNTATQYRNTAFAVAVPLGGTSYHGDKKYFTFIATRHRSSRSRYKHIVAEIKALPHLPASRNKRAGIRKCARVRARMWEDPACGVRLNYDTAYRPVPSRGPPFVRLDMNIALSRE